MQPYWRFYLTKHRREDLLARTVPFQTESIDAMPAGSLVVSNSGNPTTEPLVARGDLRVVKIVEELNHAPGFVVLER
jgi:hypothetical protein